MPVLMKPNRSMRIDATPVSTAPKNLKSLDRIPAATAPDKLRDLLDSQETTDSSSPAFARTQVNRFVDLDSESLRVDTSVPSVEIPIRSIKQRTGEIRLNGLVADETPKLRRFTPGQRSAIARQNASGIRGLVAKEVTMPERPLKNLDQALDALATNTLANDAASGPLTTDTTLRSTARRDGFGMLAIDQIGAHLEMQPVADQDAPTTVAHDLRQFLQSPPKKSAIQDPVETNRIQLRRPAVAATDSPKREPQAVTLPQLPPPIPRQDIMVANRQGAEAGDLPSPFRFDPNGRRPRDIDELLEASVSAGASQDQARAAKSDEKRGLFSVLFARAGQGTNNSTEPKAQPTKPSRRNRGLLGRILK